MLVHCHMGISRSSTVVCSYWMRRHSLPLSDTLAFLKGKRRCVCPNDGFMLQLKRLEADRDRVRQNKQQSALTRELCARVPFGVAKIVRLYLPPPDAPATSSGPT